MNPDTNKFETVKEVEDLKKEFGKKFPGHLKTRPGTLIRPNGEPVPEHWSVFTVGEYIDIKGYTFKVAYIGETSILFEPVGIPIIGEKEDGKERTDSKA